MSTVKSAFISNATGDNASSRRLLDRCQNGVLWDLSRDEPTSNTTTPKFSSDNGGTWTAASTIPGLSQASVFIDLDDYAHLVWRQTGTSGPNGSTLTNGVVYYTRGTPNAGRTAYTWATPVLVGNNTNCGYPDVVACRNSVTGGWDAFVVCSYLSGTDNRAVYGRVPISSGGVFGTVATDGLTAFVTAGTLGGSYTVAMNTFPSIDFHHTGDGKTVAGSAPHLYVAWNSGTTGVGKGLRYKKATYSAGSWTWGTEREPRDTGFSVVAAGDWLNCLYDGTRVLIAYQAAGYFVCDQRDEADTTTTGLTGSDGTAVQQLLYGGISYDAAGNIFVFGRDGSTGANGTRLLNWRKWTRASASLSAVTTIDSTAPDTPYVSVRRGYIGDRIDVLYTDGTATPWTVTFASVAAPTVTTPYVPAVLL